MAASEVRFERATRDHCTALAPSVLPADVREVQASHGQGVLEALEQSVDSSEYAWAMFLAGELGAICGACPVEAQPGTALVWMLTGEVVGRHPKRFLKGYATAVAFLLSKYSTLVQAVDARHEAALRTARHIGFELSDPFPAGLNGELFRGIRIRRSETCH